jgi:hypothetical protein
MQWKASLLFSGLLAAAAQLGHGDTSARSERPVGPMGGEARSFRRPDHRPAARPEARASCGDARSSADSTPPGARS